MHNSMPSSPCGHLGHLSHLSHLSYLGHLSHVDTLDPYPDPSTSQTHSAYITNLDPDDKNPDALCVTTLNPGSEDVACVNKWDNKDRMVWGTGGCELLWLAASFMFSTNIEEKVQLQRANSSID
jgi:hypothetical protein